MSRRDRTEPGAAEHAGVTSLIEGHARFCGGCGHDLLGLSGEACPRCGRTSNLLDRTRRRAAQPVAGKWVVATVLATGVGLALVGMKFRRPRISPGARPPAGSVQPASPATRPHPDATDVVPAGG